MKIFQSSIFRAICAVVVGILLIKYPQDGVTWLTVAIGVLFLISGIIALIAYLNAKKHANEYTITVTVEDKGDGTLDVSADLTGADLKKA